MNRNCWAVTLLFDTVNLKRDGRICLPNKFLCHDGLRMTFCDLEQCSGPVAFNFCCCCYHKPQQERPFTQESSTQDFSVYLKSLIEQYPILTISNILWQFFILYKSTKLIAQSNNRLQPVTWKKKKH